MTNNCKTVQSVQGSQRQSAAITWTTMDRSVAKRHVYKFQQQIFQATRNKDFKTVQRTKKTLFKSLYARFLAVLQVTSNKGRYTPGVDGKVLTTPEEKWNLVELLRDIKNYHPKPVRVIYIPKKDGTKRMLGIPTIKDRAVQALQYLTMIAEWEAKFEPHSFGFRPGRNPIDVIHYIGRAFLPMKNRKPHPGWVLDADISACFDNINHEALLAKLKGEPHIQLIKDWLKSGAISNIGFVSTEKGTPQGGVISPLLANIALDGMERLFGIYNKNGNYSKPSERVGKNKGISLYRYADDYIVLAPSKEILEDYVVPKIREFLDIMGLSFNFAKTRIVNISEGFDFLGFHFHRFYRSDGSIKEFIYHPCRNRLDYFLRNLKIYLRKSQHLPVQDIIMGLNRKIRGFCNYFKWSHAHKAFAYLNHRLFKLMWNWVRHRHQRKRGARWLKYHYWRPKKDGKEWVFHFKGVDLIQPYKLTVQWWKRPPVKIHSSPFDPQEQVYWKERSKRATWMSPKVN
jgi:RNA-directed DNA polymerase